MAIKEGVQLLIDLGLLEVILPFILVYTITFALLQRTMVLGIEEHGKEAGKPKTKINAMVAFVLGFFAVLAVNLLNVINIILFYFVLLLIIGLLLSLVMGLSGAGSPNKLYAALMLTLLGLFVFYGLSEAGIIDKNRFFDTLFWPTIAIIGLIIVIFYMFKGGKKKEAKKKNKPAEGAPQRETESPPNQRPETQPPS